MNEFDVSRYLVADLGDSPSDPAKTVLGYILAYQKWARDCHLWAKAHRDQIAELQTGPARQALVEIQRQFCSPANRQFHRASTGYFFYGGTYDAYPVIASMNLDDKQSATVITEKNKPHSPSFRFQLRKQGQRWLIRSLERLDASKRWVPDSL